MFQDWSRCAQFLVVVLSCQAFGLLAEIGEWQLIPGSRPMVLKVEMSVSC